MKSNFNIYIAEKFKEDIVIINNKEYVDADILTKVISELALSDALIGCVAQKLGNITISEKDVLKFITSSHDNILTTFDDINKEYNIKRL